MRFRLTMGFIRREVVFFLIRKIGREKEIRVYVDIKKLCNN